MCFRNNKLVNYVILWPRWVIGLGYIAGITLIAGNNWLGQMIPSYVVFDRLVLACFFAFVLLEQNYARNSFIKMSQLRFLSYWGNYTYRLYCLHHLALLAAYQIMHRFGLNNTPIGVVFGDNAVGLLIALAISWLSFTFFEKPFLKLKNHFVITR